MAGPQLEEGYTQIANRVLEDLARAGLSGPQFRIVLAVIRRTWGECARDESGAILRDDQGRPIKLKVARISLAELQLLTGLPRSVIAANVARLVAAGVLVKEGGRGRRPALYGYAKHADRWRPPGGARRSGAHTQEPSATPPAEARPEQKSTALDFAMKKSTATDFSKEKFTELDYNPPEKVHGAGPIETKSETNGVVSLTPGPEEKSSAQDFSGPPPLEQLLDRYSPTDRAVIDAYWTEIRRTRSTGRLAESVIRRWLDRWSAFPPWVVVEGMQIHLDRYAGSGKREEYTHGIIRRLARDAVRSSGGKDGETHGGVGAHRDRAAARAAPGGGAPTVQSGTARGSDYRSGLLGKRPINLVPSAPGGSAP